jgi:hypothetical protein
MSINQKDHPIINHMKPIDCMRNILKIDQQHRDQKTKLYLNDSDISRIDTLDPTQQWLYECPTIQTNHPSGNLKMVIRRSGDFRKVIRNEYKYLDGIDFNHIFIAGGFVCNLLCGLPVNDIDMFVYGLDSLNANYLVFDTINTLIENIKKMGLECKQTGTYTIINSVNCVTIVLANGVKIQIIFRIYSSKSEILHGFDLGSSAVGYDGKHVYMTSLSKFAYEFGHNIIDLSRRSTTYETRLVKYLQRGFGIIMPDFDMQMINTSPLRYNMNVLIDMPFLKFKVDFVGYNRMHYVDTVEKFVDVSEYCDMNIRRKIIINDNLMLSAKTFMDHYHNKYTVSQTSDQSKLIDLIIDYGTESQTNKSAIKRFINNNFVIKPEWTQINPMQQLTSSFNPIIGDPKIWYGDYFKPQPTTRKHYVRVDRRISGSSKINKNSIIVLFLLYCIIIWMNYLAIRF